MSGPRVGVVDALHHRNFEGSSVGATMLKSSSKVAPGGVGGAQPLSVNTSFASQPYQDSVTSLTDSNNSDSNSVKYRNDYSRSQHPTTPNQTTTKAPCFNTENMSPEQIRFEKYVNRFAAHDPRSSPVRRTTQKGNPSSSMSERISRFNNNNNNNTPTGGGGGAATRFTYPDDTSTIEPQQQEQPQQQPVTTTTPSSKQQPSQREPQGMSERISRFNTPPQKRFTYADAEARVEQVVVTPSSSKQPREPQGLVKRVPSIQMGDPRPPPSSQTKLQTNNGGSSSTITTATNNTSSTTEGPPPPEVQQQQRHRGGVTMTPGRYGTNNNNNTIVPLNTAPPPPPSASLRASPMSSSQRSYSYDQRYDEPSPRETIDSPSPNRVKDLRSRLWDNNETLKVAVQPSLHYVGRSRTTTRAPPPPAPDGEPPSPAAAAEVQHDATATAAPLRDSPVGPEMAGRSGHRTSRSLSPARPQYKSGQFKSRFYEAALASRRAQGQAQPPQQRTQDRIERERLQQERIEEEHRAEQALIREAALKEEQKQQQQQQDRRQQQQEEMMVMSRIQQDAEAMQQQQTLQEQQQERQRQLHHLQQPNTASRNMWRPEHTVVGDERSEGRSGDGKSDSKSEDQSVSKLVAKLAKISREDPAAALAQIDSILRAESKSSSDRDTDTSRHHHLSRIVVQEEKKENDDEEENDDDIESDDETSVSSITNPSYSGSPKNGLSVAANRRPRPNALQNYQQAEQKARHSKRNKNVNTPPPMENIKVKEPASREKDKELGALDHHVKNAENTPAAIAMKIRVWDDLSNSDSKPSKQQEEDSLLQDSLLMSPGQSANTEDLGSIVTPADTAVGSSPVSSQRSVPVPNEQTRYASPPRSNERQLQALLDIAESVGSDSLGRGLHRAESPTAETAVSQPLTPSRRRHPWDHHHPRNRAPTMPTRTVETSMEDGEGVELKPRIQSPISTAQAPYPKPQPTILQMRQEAMADVTVGGGAPRTSPRSSPKSETSQQGGQESAFMGDTFEVDPSLLKANDDFGMPLRVRQQETPSPSFFSDEMDSAWKPELNPFSNVKSARQPVSGSRSYPAVQANGMSLTRPATFDSSALPTSFSPSNLPKSYGDDEARTKNKSPGRRRFNLRKSKKNQDSIVQLKDRAPMHSYSMDTILQTQRSKSQSPGRRRASPRDGTSPARSRERSNSLSKTGSLSNLVNKFRIRRTGTKDSLTDDMD